MKKLYLYAKTIKDKQTVIVNGWIKANRHNSTIGFIELNDGTTIKNVQLVYKSTDIFFNELSKLLIGSFLNVEGIFKRTEGKQQPFEIIIKKIVDFRSCDNDYPLQKQKHNFEFLRDIAHIRGRSNTFGAINRVRNCLAMAMHFFLQKHNFLWIHTPIITSNDAEGAGEKFKVTVNNKNFFDCDAFLTVSGQLHAESLALSFGNVYTFGPTFRAEKSHTTTHASEFWMLEPEMAFSDLKDIMKIIERLIKFCIKYVLKECKNEIDFFNNFIDNNLIEKLNNVLNNKFACVTYTKVIEILKDNAFKANFENKNIFWGMDLQTEHERFITEKIFKKPVFVVNYPKEIKAFYMRLNRDNKTVAACDLLVPEVGELVGGSQREDRYDVLKKAIEHFSDYRKLEWYLDLRKYGCCTHSGFGIGFDRFLMYITGMKNIRDVQIFPRVHGHIQY
ncbi:MAG: asparagine--tRNA ligase [Bacilli bacterium]|nr:asparagine--tRNA ligase [Bacilli bacterium]